MRTTRLVALIVLFISLTAQAELAVTVSPPKIVGQKAIIALAMTNNLAEKIESARAICFLFDEDDKMIGQSAKWVVGGMKDRPALPPKDGTTFNFVITSSQPFSKTNLTAKVSFSRVVLSGDRLADVARDVTVNTATRQ